jgi:DNA invertase Pin-like site-specific DNA recombinase
VKKTEAPRRAALYARVSTQDRDQDPETQLHTLRAAAIARGWEVVETHVDEGVSGAKERRPGLDAFLEGARAKRFDVAVVFRFDRFSRSTRQLILSLDEFRGLGIDFVSVNENVDTSTPMGKVVFTLIAALAEFELAVISERVKAGLARARAQGRHLGRPERCTSDQLERARELRATGRSWRKVAQSVGVPQSTLRGALVRVLLVVAVLLGWEARQA